MLRPTTARLAELVCAVTQHQLGELLASLSSERAPVGQHLSAEGWFFRGMSADSIRPPSFRPNSVDRSR
ncbi:hypothetical protein GCM10011581_29910 [Saccharopolyspora subtropica]|uniref:Uncharacterized protein n=1 Tax=Saccharopolyspora thermophila TaxID=89367 RepID=A0A917JZ37_9PSEU|nr:hypothetical protein GCM10011581_29910 [Saccharopolyspora subtropica]